MMLIIIIMASSCHHDHAIIIVISSSCLPLIFSFLPELVDLFFRDYSESLKILFDIDANTFNSETLNHDRPRQDTVD